MWEIRVVVERVERPGEIKLFVEEGLDDRDAAVARAEEIVRFGLWEWISEDVAFLTPPAAIRDICIEISPDAPSTWPRRPLYGTSASRAARMRQPPSWEAQG